MNIFRKKYNLEELCWMITDELPEEVRLELEQRAMFWAPEAFWDIFTQFIEEYIRKDSKDVRSVKIYALLYGKTEKQIQKIFRKKIFNTNGAFMAPLNLLDNISKIKFFELFYCIGKIEFYLEPI